MIWLLFADNLLHVSWAQTWTLWLINTAGQEDVLLCGGMCTSFCWCVSKVTGSRAAQWQPGISFITELNLTVNVSLNRSRVGLSCVRTWRRTWSRPLTLWSGGSSTGRTMSRSRSAVCGPKPASAAGPLWTTGRATCRSDHRHNTLFNNVIFIFMNSHQMAGKTKLLYHAPYMRFNTFIHRVFNDANNSV